MGRRLGAICFVAVWSACCPVQQERLATAQTKLSAELVERRTKSYTLDGPQSVTSYWIIVDGSPEVQFQVPCGLDASRTARLSLDGSAERVAYDCPKSGGWRVSYLSARPEGKPFLGCNVTPGHLDWPKVPTFQLARASLATCRFEGDSISTGFSDLLAESRARDGEAGAAALLLETLAVSISGVVEGGWSNPGDEWDHGWETLQEPQRASLRHAMRRELESGTNSLSLVRSLSHADLSDPSLETVIERLGRRLAATPLRDEAHQTRSMDVIVRYLAQKRPAVAAELSCALAVPLAANGHALTLPASMLAAIAAQKASCNIDGVYERTQCFENLSCCPKGFVCDVRQRGTCTPEQLHELVREELAQPPQNPSRATVRWELTLAAAQAQPASVAGQKLLERARHAPGCRP